MKQALLLLLILASACSDDNDINKRERAEEVATEYLKSKSMFDSNLRITVEDVGENWLITYHVPEGAMGGDQQIWVDKRKMKVVASLASQ